MNRRVKPGRKGKLGKWCKKLIKPATLVKKFTSCFQMLCPPPVPRVQAPPKEENLAFMTCIVKVNAGKAGWQRAVIKLLKNCRGARFKMDQDGLVEVSGITDPDQLLTMISKSSKVELHWFQFGQCCSNLFMPETKTKEEKPSHYNTPSNNIVLPLYGDYGYNYHYQLPQQFNPYQLYPYASY